MQAADPHDAPEAAPLRVLIVEDARPVAAMLDTELRAQGMETEVAETGQQAIAAASRLEPDIMLIDLGLPDMDGLTLVEHFAQTGNCGIIVVTANDAEGARIAGLDIGADDYMVKPVALQELAARIRALHRRLTRPAGPESAGETRVILDFAHRQLIGPGRITTSLTEAEFAALAALLEAAGAPVSREALGRAALKRSLASDDRSVDQLVLKLRRKLAMHGIPQRGILSTRGVGYVITNYTRFLLASTDPAPDDAGREDG